MKIFKAIYKWLQDGNDCDKYDAIWEEWSAYHEDCDCGCYIKGPYYDEKTCRIPRFIRWLLIRRAEYFENHKYDGYGEFYEQHYEEMEKVKVAINDMLSGCEICVKDLEGAYQPCNTTAIIDSHLCKIHSACKPKYQLPPTLQQRWKTLIIDTLMVIPNQIKPFICK